MKEAAVAVIIGLFLALWGPTPTITGITPSSAIVNTTAEVSISGDKFDKTTTVKLSHAGQSDIVANNIKLVSKNQLTCSFDLNGKAIGAWDLVVTNKKKLSKKERSATFANAFRIEYAEPTIVSITPQSGICNSVVTVQINGTDFRTGSTVKLSKTGNPDLRISNVKVLSDRLIQGDVDLNQAQPDTYDLTVTNDDGKVAVQAGSFTVVAPEPEAVQPTPENNHVEPTPSPEPATTVDPNTQLQPIFFDFDRYAIRSDQIKALADDLNILKSNPNLFILIGGNADERGTAGYNLKLSAKRAEAVKTYLLQNGIDPKQIVTYAYGEAYPLAKEHNETAWQYNRRADILVFAATPSREQGIRSK